MPKKLFISYAHEDIAFRNELESLLIPMQRTGLISTWHDGEIRVGEAWDTAIKEKLAESDIVVTLLSRHFNASRYIAAEELPLILERQNQGKVEVIPIIVSAIHIPSSPLSQLQCVPVDAQQRIKPINEWQPVDPAWAQIERTIRQVLGENIESLIPQRSMDLDQWKTKLKTTLAKDIQEALDILDQQLSKQSRKYNSLIAIQARCNRNKEGSMLNVKTQQAIDIENAKITQAIQWLIDDIDKDELNL